MGSCQRLLAEVKKYKFCMQLRYKLIAEHLEFDAWGSWVATSYGKINRVMGGI